jgi:hypothetical protein
MSKRLSYFIRAEGLDPAAVKKGLGWLLEVATDRGYLAVPGLRNLDGVIGDALGKAAVIDMKSKGRTVLMGKEIHVVTKMKPLHDAGNAPILAFYPYGRFLDVLDSVRNASAILVVPWSMHEIDCWLKARNAKELGTKRSAEANAHGLSGVVETALRDLCEKLRPPSGIELPADRDAAAQMFLILKEGGEAFAPDDIKAWLVSAGGWKATHAREVAELAQEVLSGRRVLSGSSAWPRGVLEVWRSRAGKR